MSTILTVVCSLMLILTGPELLWAKTSKAVKSPPATQSVKELEEATADLQENTKDLRRNITSWKRIQWDAQLSPDDKKGWRRKAEAYLQECEAYDELLSKIDLKKLPKAEIRTRFLTARQTFRRELQYLRESLQSP